MKISSGCQKYMNQWTPGPGWGALGGPSKVEVLLGCFFGGKDYHKLPNFDGQFSWKLTASLHYRKCLVHTICFFILGPLGEFFGGNGDRWSFRNSNVGLPASHRRPSLPLPEVEAQRGEKSRGRSGGFSSAGKSAECSVDLLGEFFKGSAKHKWHEICWPLVLRAWPKFHWKDVVYPPHVNLQDGDLGFEFLSPSVPRLEIPPWVPKCFSGGKPRLPNKGAVMPSLMVISHPQINVETIND